MKKTLLFSIPFFFFTNFGYSQQVTDEEYNRALEIIVPETSYRIFTYFNGTSDDSIRYYLNQQGRLQLNPLTASEFKFHMTEGDNLFKSPGWQLDEYFTNPKCVDSKTDQMLHLGYIRTAPNYARKDWEGQVLYCKNGETFAIRATNAVENGWFGAGSFWTAIEDCDGDGIPNADYSMNPHYIWHLEMVNSFDCPPSERKVQRITNLPHLYLDTFDEMPINSKRDYVMGRLWYVNEKDSAVFYDSLSIRGRGNSTWALEKKPYKIKFKNKEKFLGKGHAKAKKWTLLANHGDKSLIRNAITSLMGEKVGFEFNPAIKFVDLTLNGNYIGNYQISDHIDVRPHRVNISEQDSVSVNSDISGGYLLELDPLKEFHESKYVNDEGQEFAPNGFVTNRGTPFCIHYPDEKEILITQTNYINGYLSEFENRLFGNTFTDKDIGYRSLVDSMSLVNWYICTEISGNIDGFYDAYIYKDRLDDRIYWGPLWDYDIAYNNDNRLRNGSNDTSFQLMKNDGWGYFKSWFSRMWEDPWFVTLVNRRYSQLVDEGLEDYLVCGIDSLSNLLSASQQLNYELWGINKRTLRERVLYSTYDEYIEELRNYIHVHMSYLGDTFKTINDTMANSLEECVNFQDIDYALAYNPQTGHLHFGAENINELTFPVHIYDMEAHLIISFRACDSVNISHLNTGVYVIAWERNGRSKKVKLKI